MHHMNELLYEILIQGDGEQLTQKVANEAGLAYRTVNEYCNDVRKTVPVQVIKAAYKVTKDPRLKKLLEPEGYELVLKQIIFPPTNDYNKEISDVNISLANLLQTIREADADGIITKKEKITIKKSFGDVLKEVNEVEALIDAF